MMWSDQKEITRNEKRVQTCNGITQQSAIILSCLNKNKAGSKWTDAGLQYYKCWFVGAALPFNDGQEEMDYTLLPRIMVIKAWWAKKHTIMACASSGRWLVLRPAENVCVMNWQQWEQWKPETEQQQHRTANEKRMQKIVHVKSLSKQCVFFCICLIYSSYCCTSIVP